MRFNAMQRISAMLCPTGFLMTRMNVYYRLTSTRIASECLERGGYMCIWILYCPEHACPDAHYVFNTTHNMNTELYTGIGQYTCMNVHACMQRYRFLFCNQNACAGQYIVLTNYIKVDLDVIHLPHDATLMRASFQNYYYKLVL